METTMVRSLGIAAAVVAALAASQTAATAAVKRHAVAGNSFIDTSHCADGSCEAIGSEHGPGQSARFYRANQKKHNKTRTDRNNS
jgi:hypothetical protein